MMINKLNLENEWVILKQTTRRNIKHWKTKATIVEYIRLRILQLLFNTKEWPTLDRHNVVCLSWMDITQSVEVNPRRVVLHFAANPSVSEENPIVLIDK